MHERLNTVLCVLFGVALVWAFLAWIVALAFPGFGDWLPFGERFHQFASLGVTLLVGAILVYELKIRDKADDKLAKVTMGRYYERDGLCFMPMVRVTQKSNKDLQAEISLYYQNRFAGVCEAVIHLRPPEGSFYSHRGARDVHFAFRCAPGAFGVIHQPIGVSEEHRGKSLPVELAAAVRWPRNRGEKLRSKQGDPIGTFVVDWALAYRQSRHELGGEIELDDPAIVHLAMPAGASETVERSEFMNETLDAVTTAVD